MKRRVSSRSYSGLFLMPTSVSAGERLPVSLNTPPSNTGTYSNRDARSPRDARNDEVAEIGIRAAEIEVELDLAHDLTISPRRAEFLLEVQASRGC